MNSTKIMGFGFSYLIHPKNIKQKFRRKLQATKAITSIYKIIEVKDVKKNNFNMWKFMCKWAFGPKHDIIHTICQIIKFFKETRLIKFF